MEDLVFDDSNSSGIWWSTNVAIRDACEELKDYTSCSNKEIAHFLRSIASSFEKEI